MTTDQNEIYKNKNALILNQNGDKLLCASTYHDLIIYHFAKNFANFVETHDTKQFLSFDMKCQTDVIILFHFSKIFLIQIKVPRIY